MFEYLRDIPFLFLKIIGFHFLFRTEFEEFFGKDFIGNRKMDITNVMEYEALAKEKLPKMVYDYYASGSEDQWTLQENRNAFSRIL